MKHFDLVRLVKKRKVVGRGGKKGKSSGRGRGGQLSRSGGRSKIGVFFEGGQMPLCRRIPRRGFVSRAKQTFEVVNLDDLEERFAAGATLGLLEFRAARLLRGGNGAKLKILAAGTLKKALHISVNAISNSARLAIEKAGGSVSLL